MRLNVIPTRRWYMIKLQQASILEGFSFCPNAFGRTRKSFCIRLLFSKIKRGRKVNISVASSDIAATLLKGGKTAHSALGLPLSLNSSETPVSNISTQSNIDQVLTDCVLIVWEESTMAHRGDIEALDASLQETNA